MLRIWNPKCEENKGRGRGPEGLEEVDAESILAEIHLSLSNCRTSSKVFPKTPFLSVPFSWSSAHCIHRCSENWFSLIKRRIARVPSLALRHLKEVEGLWGVTEWDPSVWTKAQWGCNAIIREEMGRTKASGGIDSSEGSLHEVSYIGGGWGIPGQYAWACLSQKAKVLA